MNGCGRVVRCALKNVMHRSSNHSANKIDFFFLSKNRVFKKKWFFFNNWLLLFFYKFFFNNWLLLFFYNLFFNNRGVRAKLRAPRLISKSTFFDIFSPVFFHLYIFFIFFYNEMSGSTYAHHDFFFPSIYFFCSGPTWCITNNP